MKATRSSTQTSLDTVRESEIDPNELTIQPIPTRGTIEQIDPEGTEKKKEEEGPEGGYGWFVVLGAFMVQFTAFGTASCCELVCRGIMQDHYERVVFSDLSNVQLQLSFAGTFMEMFVDLMGPVVQILSPRIGYKWVLVIGAFLMTLGLELAGLSTKVWHLYLTQGVLFGTGASFMFVIAMATTPQWFHRRRGFALGLVSSGSGFGGLVLPFVLTPINNSLGVGWAYRILGFIILCCSVIACICIRERPNTTNPCGEKKKPVGLKGVFDFGVLKDTTYALWVLSSMIALMGFFVPFFFLPSYVTYLGYSSQDSAMLLAIMAASNFIGRVTIGFLSDRIGRINTNIIFQFITGLSAFLIWTFADSLKVLIAFVIIFGFCCASYFSLMSPITATILGMQRFPTGLSVLLLSNAISVYGPSIASAIETSSTAKPYLTYKIFTGAVYILGALICLVLKIKMTKSLFAKI